MRQCPIIAVKRRVADTDGLGIGSVLSASNVQTDGVPFCRIKTRGFYDECSHQWMHVTYGHGIDEYVCNVLIGVFFRFNRKHVVIYVFESLANVGRFS